MTGLSRGGYMRKNILVYNDCSNIAEKLLPFAPEEE